MRHRLTQRKLFPYFSYLNYEEEKTVKYSVTLSRKLCIISSLASDPFFLHIRESALTGWKILELIDFIVVDKFIMQVVGLLLLWKFFDSATFLFFLNYQTGILYTKKDVHRSILPILGNLTIKGVEYNIKRIYIFFIESGRRDARGTEIERKLLLGLLL